MCIYMLLSSQVYVLLVHVLSETVAWASRQGALREHTAPQLTLHRV